MTRPIIVYISMTTFNRTSVGQCRYNTNMTKTVTVTIRLLWVFDSEQCISRGFYFHAVLFRNTFYRCKIENTSRHHWLDPEVKLGICCAIFCVRQSQPALYHWKMKIDIFTQRVGNLRRVQLHRLATMLSSRHGQWATNGHVNLLHRERERREKEESGMGWRGGQAMPCGRASVRPSVRPLSPLDARAKPALIDLVPRRVRLMPPT